MPQRTCAVDGCDKPATRREWCLAHYERIRKNGEPGPADTRPYSVVSYVGAHHRIVQERGSAANHPCIECGKQAEHWAYDHKDPDELRGLSHGRILVYSLNLEHYHPMCRSCHSRLDGLIKNLDSVTTSED